jgi:hypothetical protein
MRGPYLFPVLMGQTVTALRGCDSSLETIGTTTSAQETLFGAIALQCERHALLCYSPSRYLRRQHGSFFGRYGGAQAVLPFRISLCEVSDLEYWLPITAGAHWSHQFNPMLPVRGDVLSEAPQLVRDTPSDDWQLELRIAPERRFRLMCRPDTTNVLQLTPVNVARPNACQQ